MSGALYQRPSHCKYCDVLFDFPTFTGNIHERDVPIRQRACSTCLEEMSKDPELLERRNTEEIQRRAQIDVPYQQHAGHDPSRRRPTRDSIAMSAEDSDATTGSTQSPEQVKLRLHPQQTDGHPRPRTSSESRRSPSSVHALLN